MILIIGSIIYMSTQTKEGYYSDYQRMSMLPYITPPHSNVLSLATNASGIRSNDGRLLGSFEIDQNLTKFPNRYLPRFGPYYNDLALLPKNQGIAIYETGIAYNPNVYSEFGVITPDDI